MYCREDSLTLIEMMEDIPTLPESFMRIRTLMNRKEANIKELAEMIRTDQAIAASVLKCANSPHYNAMGHPVGSLPQAIARLGFTETSHIVMAASLLYGFTLPFGMNYIRALWAHAFAVGLICERMAKEHGLDQGEMFTAGLLHDIGKAVIGIRLDLTYFESNMAALHGEELIAAERKAYGLNHAEAGAAILRHWNLPESLQRTVAEHHNPETSFLPAKICALANTEANERFPFGSSLDHIGSTLACDPAQVEPQLPRPAVNKAETPDKRMQLGSEDNFLSKARALLQDTPWVKA